VLLGRFISSIFRSGILLILRSHCAETQNL